MLTQKIQLEADEEILTMVRKHWFPLTLQILSIVIIAIVPLLLIFLIMHSPIQEFLPVYNYSPILVVLYSAWLILCWMALFSIWTNYYLDIWTVTTKRLITVDQHGLFNRTTGSFRLERLQDVNVAVSGIMATFLKFGNLQAQTASEDQDFVARGIPNPQELKALILEAADKISYNKPFNPANGEGA